MTKNTIKFDFFLALNLTIKLTKGELNSSFLKRAKNLTHKKSTSEPPGFEPGTSGLNSQKALPRHDALASTAILTLFTV